MTSRQFVARLDRLERKRKSVAPATKFAVDPFLARVLRDDDRRLEQLDPYPSPVSEEASKLRAGIFVLARIIGCPLGYTDDQADRDRDRLDELGRKRRSPRGTLSDAEDAEEAQLRARLTAFDVRKQPDNRGCRRLSDLTFEAFRRRLSFWEQKEVDCLRVIYPEEDNFPEAEIFKYQRQVELEQAFKEQRETSFREDHEID
jgi:hypothetical protein